MINNDRKRWHFAISILTFTSHKGAFCITYEHS